jgi:HSP20 family protein
MDMALRDLVPFRRSGEGSIAVRRDEDPFLALHREMDRLFEDFWRGWAWPGGFGERFPAFQPRVDVEESESELRVTAELPGLEEKDFELQLEGDTLVLKGRKQEERSGEGGWYERSYGSFRRDIPLPCEIEHEKASASYKNGTLRVTLPKAPTARGRTRRIPVRLG